MKTTLLATAIITFWSLTAEAKGYYHRHYGHYLAVQHYRYTHRHHVRHFRHYAHRIRNFHSRRVRSAGGSLPGPCHTAARMGGPCGCWTAHNLLDVLDHVWHGYNLWLASDWLRFPRSDPAPGTAAVWKNHSHVAPVIAANRDGTVTVRDYWGTWRVKNTLVVFVNPNTARRRATYKVAGGWPL